MGIASTLLCTFLFTLLSHVSAPLLFAETEPSIIDSDEINESSGLVKSRQYPGIFWTHNDSGDAPRIFAIRDDGTWVAEVKVDGALHSDWEDIAIADDGTLYICDIGDNLKRRHDLVIYQIREPNPKKDKVVKVTRKTSFRYQSAADALPQNKKSVHFDAEACFFASGNLYILTKHDFHTELYRMDLSQSEGEIVAERISKLAIPGRVTAADVTPDGKTLAVLTYMGVHVFEKPKENDNYLAGAHQMFEQFFGQSEAIAFDGSDIIITNEESQILKVPYK
ncbi:MAG: hypothetical protein AAB317_01405 [Nitrospirota bacterium]